MNKMRGKEKLFRSLKSAVISTKNFNYIMIRILFYTVETFNIIAYFESRSE